MSGDGTPDFQDEVFFISISVGSPLDHFELVVDPFKGTGNQRMTAVGKNAVEIGFEAVGELHQRRYSTVQRPTAPALPWPFGIATGW